MSHNNELSLNGHETKGQMAIRNLSIQVAGLDEMRWMVADACGDDSSAMDAFDEGYQKLQGVLSTLIDNSK